MYYMFYNNIVYNNIFYNIYKRINNTAPQKKMKKLLLRPDLSNYM